jgi:membrane-associated PAP2 superfamily phosphatase
MLNMFLAGAASVSLMVIAMFFLRFWRKTRDRLFLFFAGAFVILMLERIIRAGMEVETEWAPYVYLVRLAAFILIIIAIVDKNRGS